MNEVHHSSPLSRTYVYNPGERTTLSVLLILRGPTFTMSSVGRVDVEEEPVRETEQVNGNSTCSLVVLCEITGL